jgi:LCP family protein required for cell wall assembly
MAQGEKPYRVYRGGRVKGRVPTLAQPERAPARDRDARKPLDRFKGPGPKRQREPSQKKTRRANWRRRVLIGVITFIVLVLVWAVASYLSLRSGANDANKRLSASTRAALVPQNGLILSNPSVILLLGTDHSSRIKQRSGFRRTDSMMLLRTDPGKGRLNYLSLPRDLRVDIPGHGFDKINAAFQIGGAPLAIRTVRNFTGVEVNHVVIVDFDSFTKVIDKVGGVTINVPAPILSNKFDCPRKTQAQCDRWQGWRFAKGPQHMDGRRARVYSRIRENKLNPRETDITRGMRQQEVIQALLSRLTSPGVLLKLPFIGGDIMRPLATDLSAGEMIQLAIVKKRSHELHCRIGGTPQGFGGGYLAPDEEARRTLAAFVGRSAPQPPLPGSAFGSGCR